MRPWSGTPPQGASQASDHQGRRDGRLGAWAKPGDDFYRAIEQFRLTPPVSGLLPGARGRPAWASGF